MAGLRKRLTSVEIIVLILNIAPELVALLQEMLRLLSPLRHQTVNVAAIFLRRKLLDMGTKVGEEILDTVLEI